MGDFYRSVADSVPSAIRGSVIKVKQTPVELETGLIVEDKEEVPLKDILSEMNLMENTGEVGTQSEDTASGGIGDGFKNNLNQIQDMFGILKKIIGTISKGSKNDNTSQNEEKEEINTTEAANNIIKVVANIPKFSQIIEIDNLILINIADYLEKNIKDTNDPLSIFILELIPLLLELNIYLDSEFNIEEKNSILQKLEIHLFFEELKKLITEYSNLISNIIENISSDLNISIAELNDKVNSTNDMITEVLDKEKNIQQYNLEQQLKKEEYQKMIIEQDLQKLKPNPTEERLLYASDYDKYMELLRSNLDTKK